MNAPADQRRMLADSVAQFCARSEVQRNIIAASVLRLTSQ